MEKFTFGIMIYNQEKIVIETLESIKYQIDKFGEGMSFNIIITDDCSKDNTVLVVEKWLTINSYCFQNIEFIKNKNNKGTVYNYNYIMSRINDEHFKIIAGDDLLVPENIFPHVSNNNNVIDTFPYYRLENGKISYKKTYLYDYFYKMKKYTVDKNIPWIKKGDFLHTPSTFYSKKLYINSKAREFNSNFFLYEDDPTFYSIFKNQKDINVTFHNFGIILYRYSSTSSSTTPNKVFLEDWVKLQVQYYNDSRNIERLFYFIRSKMDFSKRVNICKIANKIELIFRKLYVSIFYTKEFKQFYREYCLMVDKYQKYYDLIHDQNIQFLNTVSEYKI